VLLAVHDSVAGLGPGRLAGLGGGLECSYGLLRAVERSLWGRLAVRYLAVEDGGETVAATPVYLGSELNCNALLPVVVQRLAAAAVERLGVAAATRVAVVGSLISDRGGIPMHPGLGDRMAALELILDGVDRLAGEHRAQLGLLKDVHQDLPAEERARMREQGYVEGYSLPTIRVPTDVPSFDAYLERRLSKNGRKHARKQFRHAEGVYRLRAVADFAELVPRVYPLFRAVFLKAKYQFEELGPRFYAECAVSTHPPTELLLCETADGGEIVGALLVFYGERQQLDKRIGIDYRVPDGGLVYNLLNYEGIRRAIDRGIPIVDLGQSAYLPKTRLGGELTDQYLLVKGYDPLLRPTLPLQRRWMQRYRAAAVQAAVARGEAV
jgi:hypothetical protein